MSCCYSVCAKYKVLYWNVPVMQDDKKLPPVFARGLRGRNSPVCTLSQHGYGDRKVMQTTVIVLCVRV